MNPSVLIVDDDPAIRSALERVLEDTGYAVCLAADGREAVLRLEKQPFNLLLLDLDLPAVSGWDILDLARAQFAELPVLVLTGFSDECVPGSLVGADAVMEKPPDVALLLKKMAELLAEPAEKRLARRCREAAAATASLPEEPSDRLPN